MNDVIYQISDILSDIFLGVCFVLYFLSLKKCFLRNNKSSVKLYLYTDGVTEAMDKDEEQYGEDRLIKLLSFGDKYPAPSEENGIAEPVCDIVTADVEKFTNGAEQSDDITMLCIRFLGLCE